MQARKSAQDRKTEIGKAALGLVFEFGPDRVTTGKIAAKLGLTQPAIYKHFPKKDDIWNDVAQFLSQQVTTNITAVNKLTLSPILRIKALVLGHLKVIQQNPALPEFMISRHSNDTQAALRSAIQLTIVSFRSELEDVVKSAIHQKIFHSTLNPSDAAALIFGVIQSLVLRMMVTRDPAVLLNDAERLLNLQLAGFTTTGDKT